MTRRAWMSLAAGVLVLGAVYALLPRLAARESGHEREAPRPASNEPLPNIVLVTIDTLRVDRVGAYGYPGDITPTLDRLAREGARFTTAYATSSWTAPSMVSMLTGVYPARHGVTRGVVREGNVHGQQVIPSDLALLAERLRERGYKTFAITANKHLDSGFGFARGFDEFRCVGFVRAAEALQVLAEWKHAILGARPYFLWLHLFDPHAPYRPNPDWLERHWAPRQRFPELEYVHPADRYEDLTVFGERLEYVEALYDGAVRDADDALRNALESLGAESNALILLTADHGEEFGEHGHFGHGQSLFEELVHVPLLVRFPDARFAGRVIEEPVSLVDLFPTLAELTGLTLPEGLHGRSLLPALEGARREARGVLAEVSRPEDLAMWRDGSHKLVRRMRVPEKSLSFDLANDPDEHVNLYPEDPHARQLEQALLDRLADWARGDEVPLLPLAPKAVESLRSMGYVE